MVCGWADKPSVKQICMYLCVRTAIIRSAFVK